MKFLISLSLLTVLSGCQTPPTKVVVSESGQRLYPEKFVNLLKPSTVIFDTRPTFEANLNKVPGSISLPPEDFVTSRDPLEATKRLSLWGVTTETPVLVIGSDFKKTIALSWELIQAGVENVETLKISALKTTVTKVEPQKENQPLWSPSKSFGTIKVDEMLGRLRDNSMLSVSRARSHSLQSAAVAKALVPRVLILKTTNSVAMNEAGYSRVTVRNWINDQYHSEDFFLQKLPTINVDIKSFDVVYLLDTTADATTKAVVLKASGAKSIWIVR